MKAFLIDPASRSIAEIEIKFDEKGSTLRAMYAALDCRLVDVATIRALPGNDVWIDDEGLFIEDQSFFALAGNDTPYAGKALVLSCDREGTEQPPTCTMADLRRVVAWVSVVAGD